MQLLLVADCPIKFFSCRPLVRAHRTIWTSNSYPSPFTMYEQLWNINNIWLKSYIMFTWVCTHLFNKGCYLQISHVSSTIVFTLKHSLHFSHSGKTVQSFDFEQEIINLKFWHHKCISTWAKNGLLGHWEETWSWPVF